MATIKLDLDKRQKDVFKRIVVSINIHSKREYVPTGVKVSEFSWDSEKQRIDTRGGKDKVAVEDNKRIMHVLDSISRIFREYEYADKEISAKELKEEYYNRTNKVIRKPTSKDNLILAFELYQDTKIAKRTKRGYDYTLRRLKEYHSRIKVNFERASLKDIDIKFINGFDRFLMEKRKRNGVNPYHKCLRAVLMNALKEGIINTNPYCLFKIKNEQTIHRNLHAEQIRLISQLEIEHPVQAKNRDLFMLMFYMMGINCADLVNAKWSDVDNGRLVYRRKKNGVIYSVKLTEECMEIINKYKGDEYLISDGGKSADAFGKSMSRSFQKIHKDHPEIQEGITSYFARHSFATIAAIDLDYSIENVGLALGHSWVKSSVTSIYINYDLKKIDKVQRMVIDYIKKKPRPSQAGVENNV